jgi:hypothetical protein
MAKLIIWTCIILLSGCATIVKDNIYPVKISSYPPADFIVTNHNQIPVYSGHTPHTVVLKSNAEYFKGEDYSVRFVKEGYHDAFTTINSRLSGWYWGNFIFGGLIGFLMVDPATGDMWSLPKSASASLTIAD